MAQRSTKAPSATTVKINHQHDYSMLTIKLVSGDTVRYTTSWSGEKLSATASANDEYLRTNVGMSATFKALRGMSRLAGETVAQQYERIKAVAERAERPYQLVELLRAAETTPEQKREARRHTFTKHCANDGLPAEVFGATVRVNARGKGMIACTVEGYSENGGGTIDCRAADGALYRLNTSDTLRAYVMANQQPVAA